MATDSIRELKDEIMEFADLIASAALRKQTPVQDEISTRQAHDEFGRVWVEYQVSRNRIKGRRKGPYENSPVVFSRFELMALKEAEKRGAKMVRK
jgi:hypothetical protein|nr:MAG TPA: hypothetical protein [Caudoviricetes sp.]